MNFIFYLGQNNTHKTHNKYSKNKNIKKITHYTFTIIIQAVLFSITIDGTANYGIDTVYT
jgi:hypothetical protein